MTMGMRLSEHTWAKARAVLPADWTIRIRFSRASMRARTEYASVSLKEQVRILAPIRGFHPENVIYRFSRPRNWARPLDLYVTGAQDFRSVRLMGIQSA